MTYELPRTESGEVAWGKLAQAVTYAQHHNGPISAREILIVLDANARAEEREAAATAAEDYELRQSSARDVYMSDWDGFGDAYSRISGQVSLVSRKIADAIRNMEDKT